MRRARRRAGHFIFLGVLACVSVIPAAGVGAAAAPGAGSPVNPNLSPTSTVFWNRREGLMGGVIYRDHKCGGPCPGGQILRTHDGGRTWRVVHRTRRHRSIENLWLAPTGTVWAEVSCPRPRCALLQSTDGGRHWTTITRDKVYGVSFIDDLHGWALRTHFANRAGGNDHLVVAESEDGGRTWAKAGTGCRNYEFGDIARSDAATGWLACGAEPMTQMQKKIVLHTSDGAVTWHRRGKVDWDGHLSGIFFHGDGVGFRWQDRGTVLKTTNGGRTWHEASEYFERECDFVSSMWFPTRRRGYATMESCDAPRHYVVATTWNGGRNWKMVRGWGPRNPK